jgi:hypothetical protein
MCQVGNEVHATLGQAAGQCFVDDVLRFDLEATDRAIVERLVNQLAQAQASPPLQTGAG